MANHLKVTYPFIESEVQDATSQKEREQSRGACRGKYSYYLYCKGADIISLASTRAVVVRSLGIENRSANAAWATTKVETTGNFFFSSSCAAHVSWFSSPFLRSTFDFQSSF
eukprot:Clim_evm41s7 gene=Clim_evmTU41s7